MMAHAVLLDDTVTHTGTMLVPTALAVAEAEGSSGADVLSALALGYELAARIESGHGLSGAVTRQEFRHSWPAVFGAVAAAARLMGCSGEGIGDALSLMTTLSVPGVMAKNANLPNDMERDRIGESWTAERYLQLAANARNAVLTARLARMGFHGMSVALEGECGLYGVYTGRAGLPPELFYRLGTDWHFSEIGVKPYPGSWVVPVYCAETLLKQGDFTFEDIEGIVVRMVTWRRYIAVISPGPFVSQEQALMSCPFSIAACLVYGKYDTEVLAKAVGDERVNGLARIVECVGLPGSQGPGGRVGELEITLKDGRVLMANASEMPLDYVLPDSWEAMLARLYRVVPGLEQERGAQIAQTVWNLDTAASVNELIDTLLR